MITQELIEYCKTILLTKRPAFACKEPFKAEILNTTSHFPIEATLKNRIAAVANNFENIHCKQCGKVHGIVGKKFCSRAYVKAQPTKNPRNLKDKIERSHIKFNDESNRNAKWVECPICELRSKELATHYIKIHNLTKDEYKNFPVKAQFLKDQMSGDKNPAYQHGGRLSPYSKKFHKYADLTEDEVEDKILTIYDKCSTSRNANNNINTRTSYYTERGYSLEEAEKLVSERQTTFSLDKCIARHGPTEGQRVWQERQDKWQNTLNSKPQDEIDEMNRKKASGSGGGSIAEKELLSTLLEIYHSAIKQLLIPRQNHRHYAYDITIGKAIIEFNGDYWHANPAKYNKDDLIKFPNKDPVPVTEVWNKDSDKKKVAKRSGYSVLYIWESDWTRDKTAEIKKCRKFIDSINKRPEQYNLEEYI